MTKAWMEMARARCGYVPTHTGYSKAQAVRSYMEFFGPNGVFYGMLKHAAVRKLMGAFRYEQPVDGRSYDELARAGLAKSYMVRAAEKIAEYERTGNKEMLIDLMNYAALEWHRPCHPAAHFQSTERFG